MYKAPEDSSANKARLRSELATLVADLHAQAGSFVFAADNSPVFMRDINMASQPTGQELRLVSCAVVASVALPRHWHVLTRDLVVTARGRKRYCIRVEIRTWPSRP